MFFHVEFAVVALFYALLEFLKSGGIKRSFYTGGHLEENDAEGPDISGLAIILVVEDALWRQVIGILHLAGFREAGDFDYLVSAAHLVLEQNVP